MSRTVNAKRNIIWTFFSKIISIILPFITRTFFIYILDTAYLGLNGLFTSILSILSLAELGISSAITFSMYKPIANNDVDKINSYLAFYKRCYEFIGIIVLIIGISLIPFLEKLISGDIPSDINIYILYFIYLSNSVLSFFLFAYKTSLLSAYQRNDIVTKISTFVILLQSVLQICVLFLTKNYYLYLLIIPLFTLISNMITNYITKKKYPLLKPEGKLNKEEYQSIIKKVKGLIFQKIGMVVNNSVDNIVISSFLGLQVVAIYGNYYYIFNAISGICAAIISTLVPIIGNSIVTESKEKNYTQFKLFNFMYMWGIIWCSICLLCLYQPFIKLWIGENFLFPTGTVVLFSIYFFAFRMNNISGMYKEAAGIWWAGKYVPLLAAMVNLFTNLIMVRFIGVNGIVISTILSMILVYFPYGSYVLFKHYFTYENAWKKYMLNQILYFLEYLMIALITYKVCYFIIIDSILGLLIKCVICICIPNILFLIINYNNPLLKDTLNFCKKILKNS